MRTLSDLKRNLTDQQARAAYLLVINDFEVTERRTLEEIAAEVDVSRNQLYMWRTQNRDFIAYKNALSDLHMEQYRSAADRKLLELIEKGYIKALDLYYTISGRKVTRSEVTTIKAESRSMLTDAEIQRELEKLNRAIHNE